MRGRVSAVNSVFIGASNELGEFESGAVAAVAGPVGSAVIGGVGCIVVALLWIRPVPRPVEARRPRVRVECRPRAPAIPLIQRSHAKHGEEQGIQKAETVVWAESLVLRDAAYGHSSG